MKPIIFYDGGCGLCRKEIHHYQKLDINNAIVWVDIFNQPQALQPYGIEYFDAMAVLHGIDEQGRQVKGVANFVSIWQNINRYRWLAQIVLRLKLVGVLQYGYLKFAKWRFKNRMKQGCVIK